MFLLHFLPDAFLSFIVNGILILGILGFTASFFFGFVVRWIPSITPYHLLIQIVSIVLLVSGVYFKGGYSVEMDWRARVKNLEEQIKIAEAQSTQANEDLEKVRQEKVKVIRDTQVIIKEKIVKVADKIDADCKISKETTDILNDAAKGVKK